MIIVDKPADPSNYARWRPGSVNLVVVHVEQGFNIGTAATFQQKARAASAHYGIDRRGGILRFVHEEDTAWHAGNRDYNQRSVGIELEGFVETLSLPDAQLDALVELTVDICRRHSVPLDRQHIIGHDEVPDPQHPDRFGGVDHHEDPGPLFGWSLFMQRIQDFIVTPVH